MTRALRVLEAGRCTHPGFVVEPGTGLAPREFPALVAAVRSPRGVLVFDAGYRSSFLDATRPFPERFYAWVTPMFLADDEPADRQLAADGVPPEAVSDLLLSHFHGDHVAGAAGFPDARLHCREAGYRHVTSVGRLAGLLGGYLPALVPRDAAVTFHDDFPLDVGEVLGGVPVGLGAAPFPGEAGVFVVDLPGHAWGHVGLLVRAEAEAFFFLGDAVWHSDMLRAGVEPHFVSTLIHRDRHEYRRTVTKLRRLYEAHHHAVRFVPSHCAEVVRGLVARGWMPLGEGAS